MLSRRKFLTGSAVALAGAAAIGTRAEAAAIPEAPTNASPAMQPPLRPEGGQDYQPVVTLNGWTLPWRMNGEWKEFHLVAEPVKRELSPGMIADLWGYNGQSPGPTIEAVEGDKVRIFVTNKLPEHTTVHWHGMLRAQRHGRRGRAHPAAYPAGQDFRLRVHAQEERHLHVPSAFRRDGADGDGHDGHVRRASQGPAVPARGSRLRLHHERLRHHARRVSAQCRGDDGVQSVDLECARLPRHRSPARAARRPGAHQDGQSHHDQPSRSICTATISA